MSRPRLLRTVHDPILRIFSLPFRRPSKLLHGMQVVIILQPPTAIPQVRRGSGILGMRAIRQVSKTGNAEILTGWVWTQLQGPSMT